MRCACTSCSWVRSSAGGPWLTAGIGGVYRFLQRTWRLVVDEQTGELNPRISPDAASTAPELQRLLHKTIKHVTEAMESLDKMNTAVSQLMVCANALGQAAAVPHAILEDYLRLLSPMAPHICDELWERLGNQGTLAHAAWPRYDPALIIEEMVNIVVQVNSKVRTVLSVASDVGQEELEGLRAQRRRHCQAPGGQGSSAGGVCAGEADQLRRCLGSGTPQQIRARLAPRGMRLAR